MRRILSIGGALTALSLAAATETLAQDTFDYRFAFGAYCG